MAYSLQNLFRFPVPSGGLDNYDVNTGRRMFALSKGVYDEMVRKDEFFVVLLGLDGAGKTVS